MDNTSTEDQDVIREFLVESHENLSRLDQEIVELEKHPKDVELLASIFRTFHTIKGTCGFLAFSTLETITHQAENLLSQLRDGERELNPSLGISHSGDGGRDPKSARFYRGERRGRPGAF